MTDDGTLREKSNLNNKNGESEDLRSIKEIKRKKNEVKKFRRMNANLGKTIDAHVLKIQGAVMK